VGAAARGRGGGGAQGDVELDRLVGRDRRGDLARAEGGPALDLWTVTRVVVVGFGATVVGSSAMKESSPRKSCSPARSR